MCKGGRRTIAQLKAYWGTIKFVDKIKKKKTEVQKSTESFVTENSSLKLPGQNLDITNDIQNCHPQVFNEEIESNCDTDQV